MFALVDCNNFYASCERVFNPSLNGKPVVVLSNNDGCIVARSSEAKTLGIRMAEPAFKIEALLKKYSVAVFSSNYQLYGDLSNRVMSTLSTFTPELEVYSIDEAFLNLAGLKVKLQEFKNLESASGLGLELILSGLTLKSSPFTHISLTSKVFRTFTKPPIWSG